MAKKNALPPRAFTAAASQINTESFTDLDEMRQTQQAWWPRAWKYYEEIPPVFYGANYTANALSRLRLVVAEKGEDGQPVEITDGPLATALDPLKNQRGGQRLILRQIGLNLFIPGECNLVGYTDPKTKKQVWDVLSTDELEISETGTGKVMHKRIPGQTGKPLPSDALVIRIWQEHPRYGELSDSAVRTVLEQCETYLMFTRAEQSVALSRISGAGVFAIPSELIPQYDDLAEGEEPEDRFWNDLVGAMTTPIADKGDAMNVVPLLLTGPGEHIKDIKHLRFDRNLDQQIVEFKEDAVKQIALAMNLPAEVLLGQAGEGDQQNHFQAAMLRQETFTGHIQPFAEMVVDSITHAFLWPAIKKAGVDLGDRKLEDVFVWFDPSELILDPDLKEPATQAHDRLAISDAAYRRAAGFRDEDAPDEDERAKRVGVKIADGEMAVSGKPPPSGEDQLEHQKDVAKIQQTPAPGSGGEGGRPKETTTPDSASRGAPKGKTAKAPQQKGERRVSPNATKPGTVTAAATTDMSRSLGYKLGQLDVALMMRARQIGENVVKRTTERIGAKLRSKVGNNAELTASIDGVSNHDAALQLAPVVASLGFNEQDLIRKSLLDVGSEFTDAVFDTYDDVFGLIEVYLGSRAFKESLPFWETLQPRMSTAARGGNRALSDALQKLVFDYIFGDRKKDALAKAGELDRLFVKPGDLRPAVIHAGGGVVEANVPNFGGVATGPIVQELLAAAGLSDVSDDNDQKIWLYGGVPRKENFQGHLQLDGAVFSGWNNPVLEVWPEDAWIRERYYHPGDHRGCACIVAPYTPNHAEPFDAEVTPLTRPEDFDDGVEAESA